MSKRFKAKWDEDGSGGFLLNFFIPGEIGISWADEDGKFYDLILPENHMTEGWSKIIRDALPPNKIS